MERGRLIIDPPASGSWNMAVDEALLLSAAENRVTTLRFYSWSEPTVSLGYFQPLHARNSHSASRHCQIVRRATGGGAIVHDCELTYSFCTPTTKRFSVTRELYNVFHLSLTAALGECGISAEIWPDKPIRQDTFLCFQRRTAGDVVIGEKKVAGSAQRRHRKAILQHGSILLRTSRCAPELIGISEITEKQVDADSLASKVGRQLAKSLPLEFERTIRSSNEETVARRIEYERFANQHWLSRR